MRGCRLPRRPGAAGACAASRRPLQPPASQSWARATAERRPPLPRTAAVERYVFLLMSSSCVSAHRLALGWSEALCSGDSPFVEVTVMTD